MNNEERGGGISFGLLFAGVLTIVFIVLKLCGVITWRWLWVFAPLWIYAAFVAVVILTIFLITVVIPTIVDKIKIKRLRKKLRNNKEGNNE